jgi:hypothetical protein
MRNEDRGVLGCLQPIESVTSVRADRWAPYGAAGGAIAVVLFAIGSLLAGDRPAFDATGAEITADLDENRTQIQIGCAFLAASAPFLIWFLATVRSLTRGGGPGAQRAASFAYACGLVFLALFLADVTSLAVAALRPENLLAAPELAVTLRDFEFLAMGIAAFLASGVLAAFAVLILRDEAIWPSWLGWLAAVAAATYALRVGTLFTTEGAFAADGLFGLYVPVVALAGWILVGSVVLTLTVRTVSEPSEPVGGASSRHH